MNDHKAQEPFCFFTWSNHPLNLHTTTWQHEVLTLQTPQSRTLSPGLRQVPKERFIPGTAGVLQLGPSAWDRLAITTWFLLPATEPTLARKSQENQTDTPEPNAESSASLSFLCCKMGMGKSAAELNNPEGISCPASGSQPQQCLTLETQGRPRLNSGQPRC